ncbi:MAG: hypothetical protein ABFC34_13775 [Methanobacterium sp.]
MANYKSVIKDVQEIDELTYLIKVEYSNGKNTFVKEYKFKTDKKLIADVTASFDSTMQHEIKRVNNLKNSYATLCLKIGKKYGN